MTLFCILVQAKLVILALAQVKLTLLCRYSWPCTFAACALSQAVEPNCSWASTDAGH